jgi:transposase
MTITTVGIDLAKNVFAVHCIDQNGKAFWLNKVSRAALSELIAVYLLCHWNGSLLGCPLLGKIIQAVWP